jgi:hypothetical protein
MVSKAEKAKLITEREKKTKAQQKADAKKKAKEEKKTPIAK